MVSVAVPSEATARGRLGREVIVDTARRLLDEQGTDALSMRAVADALGSSPMALYRYVTDRRDLEIAVARSVSGELVLDDDPAVPPDDAIAMWMRRVRAHWLAHPWFGHFLGQHPELADFMVVVGAELLRALQRAGAGDRLAGEELIRISRTTLGVVLIEQAAPLARHSESLMSQPTTGVAPGVASAMASYSDEQLFEHVIHTTLLGFHARLDASALYQGDTHVHH